MRIDDSEERRSTFINDVDEQILRHRQKQRN